jgi:AcrR family transcriptional regulator
MTKSDAGEVVMAHIPVEQRKDEFVEAAVAVIAEHGVRGATTRRIAEAAGAPLASLHYCFNRKEDLFVEVFTRLGVLLVPADPTDTAGTRPPRTVGSFLRSAMDWMLANENYAIAQVDLYLWLLRKDPDKAPRPYEILADTWIRLLTQEQGEPRELFEEATWLAISAMDGLTLQWFYQRDDERTRHYARIHADFVDRLVEQGRKALVRTP